MTTPNTVGATARRAPARLLRPSTHDGARRLAEAVAEAWSSSPYRSRPDIPLSIVASLALVPAKDCPEEIARTINASCDARLLRGLREVWVHHWAKRPELAPTFAPLMAWLAEDSASEKDMARAVRRVVDACLRHGLLEMTGSSDAYHRSEVDVLSWTLTELRSPGARRLLGEFHTPPTVTQLIARMTVDGLPPAGERFLEPTSGSGGLFRALAQRIRELGGDPADYGWVMVDIDALAAAAAAVNAIVWDLGRGVVVACGDMLADPQIVQRAIDARRELREQRDNLLYGVATIEGINGALELVGRATELAARPRRREP
jgi:hypothetical protein